MIGNEQVELSADEQAIMRALQTNVLIAKANAYDSEMALIKAEDALRGALTILGTVHKISAASVALSPDGTKLVKA